VIPRWATVSGSQYAHSPATVIALPDARLLQQITLTLLEAGQKVVDPPAVYSKEAIQGPLQLFAGGATAIDTEYDERTGDALRYLPVDPSGLNWGGEREKIVMEAIRAALFLDQINIPYPEGEKWTATEYRGRVEQYIMRALPLFEPMEVEYNGGVCEQTFELLMDMNGFGDLFSEMPEALQGQDIKWMFESPLAAATERAKSQAFVQSMQLLKIAVEADPMAKHDFDVSKSFRDAITGTGGPADWIVPEDQGGQGQAGRGRRRRPRSRWPTSRPARGGRRRRRRARLRRARRAVAAAGRPRLDVEAQAPDLRCARRGADQPATTRREWRALLALQAGNASEGQQRMALKWIVEKASGYYEISFRGGPDGARDTDFMEGRRFVGQQIVKQFNTSRAKKDVA
jgi:hypothetical protein